MKDEYEYDIRRDASFYSLLTKRESGSHGRLFQDLPVVHESQTEVDSSPMHPPETGSSSQV